MSKSLEELKKDLAFHEQEFEKAKQQVAMLLGITLYLKQEIEKLENPAKVEEGGEDGTKSTG
jgi:hypothetical protein